MSGNSQVADLADCLKVPCTRATNPATREPNGCQINDSSRAQPEKADFTDSTRGMRHKHLTCSAGSEQCPDLQQRFSARHLLTLSEYFPMESSQPSVKPTHNPSRFIDLSGQEYAFQQSTGQSVFHSINGVYSILGAGRGFRKGTLAASNPPTEKGFTSTPAGKPNSACRRNANSLVLGRQHHG